jgi:peptidoglycan/LPS O-acetylase OafA/YrhL
MPALIASPLAEAAPPASSTPPVPLRPDKLRHLQILRALAASLVVADHGLAAIDHFGVASSQYHQAGGLMGHLGVTAFFVLSGLIMVRQTEGQFGVKGAPLQFALRRIVRIVPMYWIATLVWFLLPFHRPLWYPKIQLLLSLSFIPDFLSGKNRLEPVLGVGWTLNYEMAFYFLFAVALLLPRRRGIVLLLALPEFLMALGHAHLPFLGRVPLALFRFGTDDIIASFTRGVLIGLFTLDGDRPFRLRLPFSPAFLVLLPPALSLAMPYTLGRLEVWDLLAWFSVIVVLLCALEDNAIGTRLERFLVLLGDASYSTYLFHVLVLPFILPAGIFLWGQLPRTRLFTMLLLAASVAAANALGLLIHKAVESPLTGFLKRLRFSPARRSGDQPAMASDPGNGTVSPVSVTS